MYNFRIDNISFKIVSEAFYLYSASNLVFLKFKLFKVHSIVNNIDRYIDLGILWHTVVSTPKRQCARLTKQLDKIFKNDEGKNSKDKIGSAISNYCLFYNNL